MALQNAFGDLALDQSLQDILTELQGKLDAGGTVALDAATLAALESITATVTNTDFPDAATLAKLEQIRVILAAGITVTGGLTDAQLRATPVPISGTVSTGGLTDTQLRATAVPVSGTVSTGLTQPLTDTQLRATAVPVSGPITDTQIRATPLPVSGTVTATGPLTDTQLRATPVPVSGTVTTGGLTDTQLRATPVPVSGTVAATQSGTWTVQPGNTANTTAWKVDGSAVTQPVSIATTVGITDLDIFVTGQATQTTLGNNILLAVAGSGSYDTLSVSGQSMRSIYVQVIPTGTVSSGAVNFEGSNDNTTFVLLQMYDDALSNGSLATNFSPVTSTNRYWSGPTKYRYIRFRIATAIGGGGSIQAIAKFSTIPYTPSSQIVSQATGSSLQTVITAPTLTKGTQGGTGFSVQNLKDAGRVRVLFSANAVASGTTGTETAISLTKAADNGATSSAASFVITSAKRFRIEAINFCSRGHNTATPQVTTFNFRINTAGAVTATSTPIILSIRSATIASNEWDRVTVPIPDGMEILGDGTIQFGITANAVFTTNAPTWDVNLIGYEY